MSEVNDKIAESLGKILGGLTIFGVKLFIAWCVWRIAVAAEIIAAGIK